MNAKNLTKTIIGLIIFLLSVNIIIAASANVVDIVKGSDSASLCPRETGLFTDVVKNLDTKAREFTITNKGSASAWATTIPNGFTLSPGESKTVYSYVTPVQNADPSTYDLTVTATTEGYSKESSHKLAVKKCYGSTLAGNEAVKRACPSEVVKYIMTLTNNGEYKESFLLSSEGQIKEKVTLSDRVVTLEKGETKSVFAYVNSPKDDGSYGFNLKAESQTTKDIETFNAMLNVDPCYSFAVNMQGNNSYSICERTLLTVPMLVENKGTVLNRFKLNIEGPEWVRLDKNEFIVYPGSSEPVTLAAAPTYGVEGDFNAQLTVVPEKGDLKAASDFRFSVRKCHSVKAVFVEQNVSVCNGLKNSFDAIITNDGEFRKQYSVEADAPIWVSSNIPTGHLITLEPGRQQKITFTSSPGDDVNESIYMVNLKVNAVDESKTSVFASAQSYIKTILPVQCYKPTISTQFENITVYYDSSITLPLNVKNDGLNKVTYDILLSGSASNFVKLVPAVLSIDAGKSEISYLYIAPTPQLALGQYDAVISVKLKDGSFLLSRKIPITVTDNRELATSVASTSGNNLPAVILQEEKQPTRWQRFKAWLKRNFSVEKKPVEQQADVNLTIQNDVAKLERQVSQDKADVNALGKDNNVVFDEKTSAAETPAEIPTQATRIKDVVKTYKYYILAGIIALLVIIIFIRVDFFKKAREFFEEED